MTLNRNDKVTFFFIQIENGLVRPIYSKNQNRPVGL